MTSEWLLNLFQFQFGNSKQTNYGNGNSKLVVFTYLACTGYQAPDTKCTFRCSPQLNISISKSVVCLKFITRPQ